MFANVIGELGEHRREHIVGNVGAPAVGPIPIVHGRGRGRGRGRGHGGGRQRGAQHAELQRERRKASMLQRRHADILRRAASRVELSAEQVVRKTLSAFTASDKKVPIFKI